VIVVMKPGATDAQIEHIVARLAERGLDARILKGAERPVIAVIGKVSVDVREFEDMPGVAECTRISRPYKLASREWKVEPTVVRVGEYAIGGPQLLVMAGPCSVENRGQLMEAAEKCREAGAHILRGGAFKPRTSPYAFQGLGEEGLALLAEAREKFGMPVVTEVVAPAHAPIVARYSDILQIGARNMQNFELLKAVSEVDKPVLLKRGISATIEELLMAAEYVLSGGNANVILCERGIRTYETATRNTLDLSAIPVLRALTHLPVIVDPSHGTGHRIYVAPMALAAVAAGADGVMIEVHPDPTVALSDGPQSLYPRQLDRLLRDVEAIAPVVGRHMPRPEAARRPAPHLGQSTAVAYQGQAGAFSEKAARQYFGPEVEAAPHHSFRDVFEAVEEGRAAHAVVPVENSLTGSIHENYDLLLDHDLQIVGELKLRIVHNLIGQPGATREGVRTVYAHPQAAGQCEEYLRRHGWQVVNVYDTAGSVAHVKGLADPSAAAIAGPEAARIYGMEILQEAIEDHPSNYTRFIVLAREGHVSDAANKTTIVFRTENKPGALLEALRIVADHGINMVKLESRPIPGQPWEYMFYADLEGAGHDEALAVLAARTPFMRRLGTYHSAVAVPRSEEKA
jgi:3-deoxy-7-phosphoheptulonate synthase